MNAKTNNLRLRKKNRDGQVAVKALLVISLFIGLVFVIQLCAKAIQSIGPQYYHLLPVSNAVDIDKDGIADNYDDSDGDGIADTQDITPYGKDIDLLEYRSQFRQR